MVLLLLELGPEVEEVLPLASGPEVFNRLRREPDSSSDSDSDSDPPSNADTVPPLEVRRARPLSTKRGSPAPVFSKSRTAREIQIDTNNKWVVLWVKFF